MPTCRLPGGHLYGNLDYHYIHETVQFSLLPSLAEYILTSYTDQKNVIY